MLILTQLDHQRKPLSVQREHQEGKQEERRREGKRSERRRSSRGDKRRGAVRREAGAAGDPHKGIRSPDQGIAMSSSRDHTRSSSLRRESRGELRRKAAAARAKADRKKLKWQQLVAMVAEAKDDWKEAVAEAKAAKTKADAAAKQYSVASFQQQRREAKGGGERRGRRE